MKTLDKPTEAPYKSWDRFCGEAANDVGKMRDACLTARDNVSVAHTVALRIRDKALTEPSSRAITTFLDDINDTLDTLDAVAPLMDTLTGAIENGRDLTTYEKLTSPELCGMLAEALDTRRARLQTHTKSEDSSLSASALSELRDAHHDLEELACDIELDSNEVLGEERYHLDNKWDETLAAIRDAMKTEDPARLDDVLVLMGGVSAWLESRAS